MEKRESTFALDLADDATVGVYHETEPCTVCGGARTTQMIGKGQIRGTAKLSRFSRPIDVTIYRSLMVTTCVNCDGLQP